MALASDGGDGKGGKRHILVVTYDRESDNTTPVAGLQLSMQVTCGAALFSMYMMRLKTMNTTVRVREDGRCDYWYCLMLNTYKVGRIYPRKDLLAGRVAAPGSDRRLDGGAQVSLIATAGQTWAWSDVYQAV